MSVSALLLTQTAWLEKKKGQAVFYGAVTAVGSATLLLTLSRSALLSYIGVLAIVVPAMLLRTARRPGRVIALTLAAVVALGGVGLYVTQLKFHQVAVDDWETALYNNEHYGAPIIVDPPEERRMTLDDLTSDRYGIWRMALSNLTLFGHETAVVEEWAAWDGGARRFNSHNSFVAVAYQNGWPRAFCSSATWRFPPGARAGITGCTGARARSTWRRWPFRWCSSWKACLNRSTRPFPSSAAPICCCRACCCART